MVHPCFVLHLFEEIEEEQGLGQESVLWEWSKLYWLAEEGGARSRGTNEKVQNIRGLNGGMGRSFG